MAAAAGETVAPLTAEEQAAQAKEAEIAHAVATPQEPAAAMPTIGETMQQWYQRVEESKQGAQRAPEVEREGDVAAFGTRVSPAVAAKRRLNRIAEALLETKMIPEQIAPLPSKATP